MALYMLVIDTTSGATKRTAIPYPGWVEESFTGGGTVFTLARDIDTQHVLDVLIDGVLQDTAAYTVDASANTVTLSEAVSSLHTVRVRIYLH